VLTISVSKGNATSFKGCRYCSMMTKSRSKTAASRTIGFIYWRVCKRESIMRWTNKGENDRNARKRSGCMMQMYMDTEALVSVLMRAHLSSRVCVLTAKSLAQDGKKKKKNCPDGELWAMASMAHERDTLVRAYPLWRFRLSKPKFPSCCINPHRSCGVTHINRLICFSRAEFGIV